MKVNRTYKVVRPMRKFGNLIKDLFSPILKKKKNK